MAGDKQLLEKPKSLLFDMTEFSCCALPLSKDVGGLGKY